MPKDLYPKQKLPPRRNLYKNTASRYSSNKELKELPAFSNQSSFDNARVSDFGRDNNSSLQTLPDI